jgi:predicted TIM-barrel fold metal-dependent hydrolase
MIIDFRGRPPSKEFLSYFDVPRMKWIAERVGAPDLSPAYLAASVESFIEEMNDAGITWTVALGRNSPAMTVGKRTFPAGLIPNDHIADLQKRYPDRIIGMAGIDVSNRVHESIPEIERCVRDLGMRGIFIEPQRALRSHPDDPRIAPVYEKCLELDVPVVIMSGPFAGPDLSYTDPAHIDAVATQFPGLKIVCGHGCWPYVNEIIAVAFKHPTVYVSPDVYHFVPGSEAYVEAANGFMADQLLFGTAYPVRALRKTVEDFKRLPFTPAVLEKALYDNARRLLRL